MPCKCNPPGNKSKGRERAEVVLRQRAVYRSPVDGLAWDDIACRADCPGWDVFQIDEQRSRSTRDAPPPELGAAVQACDECNQIAKSAGLPILHDADARELPAAKRELRRLQLQLQPVGNPRSTLTGPGWSPAREKLRGAAAGTRKNPRGDLQREFDAMLRDPDPSAMQIAEDMLLTEGVTLAEAGRWRGHGALPTAQAVRGEFVLEDAPVTSAGWAIDQQSKTSFVVTILYTYQGEPDKILSGAYLHSLAEAQRVGAADAWSVAKALRHALATDYLGDLRTMVQSAYAGKRPDLEGPRALYEARFNPNPGLRILHLEDDPQIAAATKRVLRASHQAEVTSVDSVRLAIEALEANEYDLIISDYDVKGGTADELVEYLRMNQPAELDHFFFMSGNERAAAWGYPTLEKPASAAEVRRMVDAVATKQNPANPSAPAEALAKYEEFHRYAPTLIGEFARGFEIPRKLLRAGPARWTTYRSPKVDPATLKRPRRPVNYIHEHDAGVGAYVVNDATNRDFLDSSEVETVPAKFRDVAALVKLGDALGFCFASPVYEEDVEVESTDPLPELYCTPDGKCLLVIQDKSEVLAMIWGGGLGVYARGIDG